MNDTIAQRKARGYERLVSERDAAIKRAEAAQAAIAQAVQDEREACAKVADGIWHLLDVEGNDHDHVVTEPIAAAIRARQRPGEEVKDEH